MKISKRKTIKLFTGSIPAYYPSSILTLAPGHVKLMQ
jgi:hypothetical protein